MYTLGMVNYIVLKLALAQVRLNFGLFCLWQDSLQPESAMPETSALPYLSFVDFYLFIIVCFFSVVRC